MSAARIRRVRVDQCGRSREPERRGHVRSRTRSARSERVDGFALGPGSPRALHLWAGSAMFARGLGQLVVCPTTTAQHAQSSAIGNSHSRSTTAAGHEHCRVGAVQPGKAVPVGWAQEGQVHLQRASGYEECAALPGFTARAVVG
jgi:hypothetical protein